MGLKIFPRDCNHILINYPRKGNPEVRNAVLKFLHNFIENMEMPTIR